MAEPKKPRDKYIGVHMEPALIRAIDDYRRRDLVTRSEAIRQLLRQQLGIDVGLPQRQ